MPTSLRIMHARAIFLVLCLQGGAAEYEAATSRRVPVGRSPRAVVICDVNRDGKPDLLVANGEDGTLTVLLGDGKGGFKEAPGSPVPVGAGPNDLCVGDFNADGKPDVAIANHDQKSLTVLLGNGRGGFTRAAASPVAVQSRPHVHGVAVGDFDGDGRLDLATESWAEDKVTVVYGDGRGGFREPGRQFSVGRMPYQRLRAADLNGDGRADLVTTNLEDGTVTVLLGDPSGLHPAPGSPFACGKKPFGVAIGDLNGDGRPDLAVVNWVGQPTDATCDALNVLLGDGKGGFTPMRGSPFATGRAPATVAIGDVNGDGVADVVVANYAGGNITVFLGENGTLRNAATLATGQFPCGVAVGDLNGDGKADIVVANEGDGYLTLILSK